MKPAPPVIRTRSGMYDSFDRRRTSAPHYTCWRAGTHPRVPSSSASGAMRLEKLGKKMIRVIVPPLAAALIRLTRWTMRLTWVGREKVDTLRAQRRPYIHAFWHGHLFMM